MFAASRAICCVCTQNTWSSWMRSNGATPPRRSSCCARTCGPTNRRRPDAPRRRRLAAMHARPVTLLATGDLIIDEPDPDSYFDLARSTLRQADIVVGHVEVPFTLEREGTPNVPRQARDPAKLSALANAGVRLASLAANHVYDDGQ